MSSLFGEKGLLKVDTLAASLGVYVPAVVVQRALALGRAVLFMWMLGDVQYGLWALGCMVFGLGGAVVTLGSYNGVARYVSHYQARGQLEAFYRAVVGKLTALALGLTGAGVALSAWLAPAAMGTLAEGGVSSGQRLAVFCLAMLNALLTALYLNLTAWMRGLRVYRLLSAIDLLYGLLFVGLGLAALRIEPTASAALIAHAASLALAMALGWPAVRRAVRASQTPPQVGPDRPAAADMLAAVEEAEVSPAGPTVARTPELTSDRPIFRRLLAFSAVSMAGMLLWQVQGYVSLRFVQLYHGESGAGVYQALFSLLQAIPILATTVWAVMFSHISLHWERGDRDLARTQLEAGYKAVVLGLATLAAVLLLTADWWTARVLPPELREARPLLPWLLVHFLSAASLGYVHIVANLRERPMVLVGLGATALLANAALAAWLTPAHAASGGAVAAGLASAGCVAVGAVYLLGSRFGAGAAAMALSFAPLLMLLGGPVAAAAVAGLWAAALATPAVWSARQKQMLVSTARRLVRRNRGPARDGGGGV